MFLLNTKKVGITEKAIKESYKGPPCLSLFKPERCKSVFNPYPYFDYKFIKNTGNIIDHSEITIALNYYKYREMRRHGNSK